MITSKVIYNDIGDRIKIREEYFGEHIGKFYFFPARDSEGKIIGINEFPTLNSAVEATTHNNIGELRIVTYGPNFLHIDFLIGDEWQYAFEKYLQIHQKR
jgi:hypothetical protein